MQFNAWKRLLLSLAGLALVMCIGPPKAHAQDGTDPSYSSFTAATFSSGYQFTIGGSSITNFLNGDGTLNLSAVNATNGDFRFGFTNGGQTGTFMVATMGSQTLDITGIDGVYLVANGPSDGKDSVSATPTSGGKFSSSANITDYAGVNYPPAWAGGPAPGANFPSYGAANFGSGNILDMSNDATWNTAAGTQNGEFGDYTFNSIALSGATSGAYFGMHARWLDSNGQAQTGFLIFGSAPVPEPAYFQLGGLLALSGLGSAFRRLRKRRTA
ncbi:MAG TPA: hypothetical protein VFA07_18870 [Chthonomonadaceae bacterium]|nr:hypothetical protein [Chthonomonadaceae bacterium]